MDETEEKVKLTTDERRLTLIKAMMNAGEEQGENINTEFTEEKRRTQRKTADQDGAKGKDLAQRTQRPAR